MIQWSKLEELLGINARNIDYVFHHNPRKFFPLVDNKLTTKKLLAEHNLPHPPMILSLESLLQLDHAMQKVKDLVSMVIKPARGMGGTGILVVFPGESKGTWQTASGKTLTLNDVREHMAAILFGVYSVDNSTDQVLVEKRISVWSRWKNLAFKGLPDIRVLVYHNQPVQAMLRLPTKESEGKANLHMGGVGVGINLATGITAGATHKGQQITRHPDTGELLRGWEIPHWQRILKYSKEAAALFGLGYMGIDWVVDEEGQECILELNARPGIEIQNANFKGLKPLLKKVDEELA